MRRLVTRFLDGLPCDPRSRRALDETLLDWAHEEATETSTLSRARVAIAGLLSIVRAFALSAGSETPQVPLGWLAGRTIRIALVLAAPLAPLFAWPVFMSGFGVVYIAGIFATFLPGAVLTLVGPALVLVMAWRPGDRRVPPAAAALLTAVAVPLLTAAVTPLSVWALGELYPRAIAESIGTTPQLSVELAVDLTKLVGIAGGPVVALLALTGSGAVAGACVLFGAALLTRVRLHSVLWLVAIPMGYLAVGAASNTAIQTVSPEPFGNAVGTWVFAGVILMLAAVLGRRSAPPPDETGTALPVG
jgi:hypothetical protein